uniref:PDZ and LIM domain protein Zasp n=1 Tax=Trichogramma kaykai TaxID=54128 RepID=A0ABD2X499_9HYME
MAQLISVKLSRFDGSPWGFRLQGGKDFGTPLVVQKVNNGSPAEAAGLRAGDAVVRVNSTDMFSLRHKDAQDVIVRAGNNFEMTVQRGAQTWRPSVSPVTASIPSPQPSLSVSSVSPVTKTSLAHKQPESRPIGSGHNFSPKPFLNGAGADNHQVKSIVNKQYNSPVGIYSEEAIAETLSAQAEVLAGGALGVNFKKNEKNYTPQNSEVFKMVQEADKEPRTPEPAEVSPISGTTSPALAGLRPVQGTQAYRVQDQYQNYQNQEHQHQNQQQQQQQQNQHQQSESPATSLSPGQNICVECERLIVGVFVRIKEKSLHVECFKCATCGTSLKNVGYYNINNKLYCDIHAKLVARQSAPATNIIPITIAPGHKAPANTISSALSSHGNLSPSLSNHGSSSPQPFVNSCPRAYSPPKSRPCSNGHVNGNSARPYGNSAFTAYASPALHTATTTTTTSTSQESLDEQDKQQHHHQQSISNSNDSKMYTSTISFKTITNDTNNVSNNHHQQQQMNEKQQEPGLDYNRNSTINNDNFDGIDYKKLHKISDDLRDCTVNNGHVEHQDKPLKNKSLFEERNYSSEKVQTSVRSFKAPSSNISGPKPFIGSSIINQNYSSSSIINTGSTLPRPQSQSLAETYYVECHEHSQSGSNIQFFQEDFSKYEFVQESCRPKAVVKQPKVKNKTLKWPPVRAIEDITYPTASPIYIDPNPSIDQRIREVNRERRATVEQVISKNYHQQQQYCESKMEQHSCPGPQYRRVSLVNKAPPQASCCLERSSRAGSSESVRRSLTPTRITQPTPRPWTATVTSGTNLYESSFSQETQSVCQSDGNVCQKVTTRESSCERPAPDGHKHQERHVHREEDTCKQEDGVHRHEHKTSKVCKFTCEAEPEPAPKPLPPPEPRDEGPDYSKIVPPDVAICPKGIDAEHDLYTEVEEEDKDNLHIKKTTTYEKTIELVSPDAALGNSFGQAAQATRSSTVDREVEDISCRRNYTESLSQKIDTQQMIEETRRQDEEGRQRKAEEDRRQREEAERRRQEEERQMAELRRRDEEQRRRKEEAERQRRVEEQRRMEKEEAGRNTKERIIDIKVEERPCSCASDRAVEVTIRAPSRERIIPVQLEQDKPPCKKEIHQVVEQVCVKQHCEHGDYEEQRKRSLREQVEVHQSLRDQQGPCKRQPTLQERRISSRLSQKEQSQQQCGTTTKKHVQFVKHTETGPCPLPSPSVKNSSPKEYKSEMCKALTTAPDRQFSPLQSGVSNQCPRGEAREVYHREVTYEQKTVCCRCQPQLPPLENRPISPFVAALTTAPDTPYSPLGRQVDPSQCSCRCRSQTPEMMTTYEGYSSPAQILYRGKPKEQPKKPDGPRPLPTPPPDFRFRNRSASPSQCRSRSQTPSGRVSSCGLKKPDTIPSYQKHLVCEEQKPVQGQDYPLSRNSTPSCCQTVGAGPPEPPACIRAQAPRIREEPPCKREPTPDRTETTRYHWEEDTPQGHKTKDTVVSKNISWAGQGASKHAHIHEHDDIVTEECDGYHHSKKTEHFVKDYVEPEDKEEEEEEEESQPPEPSDDGQCYIAENSCTEVTLPCPNAKKNQVMDRIQKTGVRVFAPIGGSDVRRICHEIPTCPPPKPPCPMTGVQVLPVRAHGDTACKQGVVVVPCDGIGSEGVCIKPTPDRSGVSVSPCPAKSGGVCQKPSCYCGSVSGNCQKLPNVETTRTITNKCQGIPGMRSVQCPKPAQKCLGAAKARLPFPNIPLPEELDVEEPPSCPRCCPKVCSCTNSSTTTTTTTFKTSSDSRDCGFQPIQPPPRTNLCNQITTLTLCKRETKPAPAPPIPTVQLYKPVTPPPPPCRTSSSQIKCQTTQKRFRSEITSSSSQSSSFHCLSNKTQSSVDPPNCSSHPDLGAGSCALGSGNKITTCAAPNRGRGILNQAGSGMRVPLCASCNNQVRGPFISALGSIWCPEHFVCVNPQCRRGLQDIGFVEEKGQLYCEYCFEKFIAPSCNKCNNKIKGDCLNAIGKHFHPQCFSCAHCKKEFGSNPFFLEEGLPYCEKDWNELFTTKCFACGFPVEAGDRWVEALNNNYHSQCFNCTMCKKNLEGQSFYAKGGRPFCKNHAR